MARLSMVLAFGLTLGSWSCCTFTCSESTCGDAACSEPPARAATAQRIVEEIVAAHPEVVRLTIHAVPEGGAESCIIASNIATKVGQPSDPEDLEALATGAEVVLTEGEHLDVTIAITEESGQVVAATGITLQNTSGRTREQLLADARAIAHELTTALRAAPHPLW